MARKSMVKRRETLRQVAKIQKDPGNAYYDEYMRGMANGLELAESIMFSREPKYLNSKSRNFEIGKYYQHSSGNCMHIVGSANTSTYGWTLIGEEISGNLRPVGVGEGYAENWYEISEEDWFEAFDGTDQSHDDPAVNGVTE